MNGEPASLSEMNDYLILRSARERLAKLLPECDVAVLGGGDEPIVDIDGLFAEEATALADRLERGDFGVAAVQRVRALCARLEWDFYENTTRNYDDEFYDDEAGLATAGRIHSALDPEHSTAARDRVAAPTDEQLDEWGALIWLTYQQPEPDTSPITLAAYNAGVAAALVALGARPQALE